MTTATRTIAGTWNIDPAHTDVGFAVRHMGISTVRGAFRNATGTIRTDEDGAPTQVRVDIPVETITTGNDDRDQHLRSADFFASDEHPTMTFEADRAEALGEGRYALPGRLTMRGTSEDVNLEAEIGEPITDPYGLTRRAASVAAKIDRRAWGLTWNQVLEAGSLMVSETVRISVDVQATLDQDA